ncbi:26S proteasome non-ATPase regulatory subunit [Trichinella spiralis]|uniref:26S proteasome non-ATPase regulatory subunit n=1 Tax=Trichinella spiralis TaxID=6334 RepID=A0ABR3KTV3_TRISP
MFDLSNTFCMCVGHEIRDAAGNYEHVQQYGICMTAAAGHRHYYLLHDMFSVYSLPATGWFDSILIKRRKLGLRHWCRQLSK